MNRRHLITAAAGALFAAAPSTASPADLRPADLRDDIEIVRRALALHPGLYRYATPGEVEARLAALRTAFAAASTEARYLLLSRFLATIRCGHSYCNFFNQPKALASGLFDRRTRLPFHFIWLDGKMVVTADPSGLGAPPGAEVLSVNDVPAPALLTALMPYARADGHNDAKRAALLGVTGVETIETFDVFHGLVFGAPVGGRHRVSLRRATGEDLRLELPALGLAERQAQMKVGASYAGADPFWTWTVRPDGVAVLAMPSWAMFNSTWNWRAWLDARLDSLSGRQGLILDLRDNEGGNDCGDEILARLTAAPIPRTPVERRVRFQRTPRELDPYLDTWDNSFRTLGVGATPLADGFYRLTGDKADNSIAPRGTRLQGRVAALIGPMNSSATFQFAQRARASGLVKLFGQTTGGNQRGINGGCFFFVRLPASGIEFDLPLIGDFPPGSPPDAGLTPDVIVTPTPADLAQGHDRTLEQAARWVIG